MKKDLSSLWYKVTQAHNLVLMRGIGRDAYEKAYSEYRKAGGKKKKPHGLH